MTDWREHVGEMGVNWNAKPGVKLDYAPDRSEDARWSDLMRMLDEQAEEAKRQQRRAAVATCVVTFLAAAFGASVPYLVSLLAS